MVTTLQGYMATTHRLRELTEIVAQISNLPYRRIAFCPASKLFTTPVNSNSLQNAILRYGRLETCVTR